MNEDVHQTITQSQGKWGLNDQPPWDGLATCDLSAQQTLKSHWKLQPWRYYTTQKIFNGLSLGKKKKRQNCVSMVGNTFSLNVNVKYQPREGKGGYKNKTGWCRMLRLWLVLRLLGSRVTIIAFLPFTKRDKSILCQTRQKGTWTGVGKSFQHRTSSSKKLCGLHLQGDLSPSQMPRQRGTCKPQRQHFLGFPLQHRRLPSSYWVLLFGRVEGPH